MDRRKFVGTVGAITLAPLPISQILGCAPVARGGRSSGLDKVGLQLYTVRREMEASVERTLYEVAAIGYREVEFAGYFGRPPRAIRQLLDRNKLSAPAAHVSIAEMRSGWFRTLDNASAMEHKWLVVPSLPEADRNSLDALKRTADLFNRSSEDAKSFKIRVAYHNHDIEFTEVEGQRIFDVLLENTNRELVDFELDLYWITKAGVDPLPYFEAHPGRFPLLHVKDAGPPPDRDMTEVGKGTIDFAKIFQMREQAGFKHYFVEHDNPTDSMVSAATSYRYLKSLEI
jgi:sugar phosphate isomerase/epimerase